MEVKKDRKKQVNKYLIFLLLLTAIVGIYTWFFLVQLKNGDVISVDEVVRNLLSGISIEFVITIFTLLTDLGSKWGVIAVLIGMLVFMWWKYRDYLAMVTIVVVAAGGDQLNKFLKGLIARERPLLDPTIYAEGYSFPSGHAMVGIMFYGFIAYYLITKLQTKQQKHLIGWMMAIIIFLIGISRIVLNAHYPTDVFGGFGIGLILLIILLFAYEGIAKALKK
ncbi:phosphatase PAP2 family protein [Bacillus sp. PS06]|uniref:phosphatase PAP2 family protein n=1 Tax=Bacillus sp. PS06 TaxID=2764176 RepID=UPI00177F2A00|nr:phosphatase PAP2 family protein [Bacillus sp. PS06]MBD8067712.1 phosphatase PAP2 family protein [Bacillus sp. PS06]